MCNSSQVGSPREWEDKPQTGRKYLQNTYLKKDCYPKCTKNSILNTKSTDNLILIRAKDLNRQLMIQGWHTRLCKDAPPHMSSGKCNLKQRWGTTPHLLERLTSRTRTTPSAGEDVENQNSLSSVVGVQNGAATVEGSLAVSYKTKHTLTHNPATALLNT